MRLILAFLAAPGAQLAEYSFNLPTAGTITVSGSGTLEAHVRYHTNDGSGFTAPAVTAQIVQSNRLVIRHDTSNQLFVQFAGESGSALGNTFTVSLAGRKDISVIAR